MKITRLELTDTVEIIPEKMTGFRRGQVGHLRRMLSFKVVSQMLGKTYSTESGKVLDGETCVFCMDELGIYDNNVWKFYRNVGGSTMITTMLVLMAYQMGIVTKEDIVRAFETQHYFDFDELNIKVDENLSEH